MSSMFHSQIQDLKRELQSAKVSYRQSSELTQKRELLEKEIQELSDQLDADTLTMQAKSLDDTQSYELMPLQIEQNQHLLYQMKLKKRDLDHLLDSLEDSSKERIDILQTQLIEKILFSQPNLEPVYIQLRSEIDKNMHFRHELKTLVEVCEGLTQKLETILAARELVRRRWIFSYLFGKNPNVIITQQLRAIEQLCASALIEIRTHNEYPTTQEIYEEMKTLLEMLHNKSKERWGFRKIDTVFTDILQAIRSVHKQFTTLLDTTSRDRESLDSRLENLLKSD